MRRALLLSIDRTINTNHNITHTHIMSYQLRQMLLQPYQIVNFVMTHVILILVLKVVGVDEDWSS